MKSTGPEEQFSAGFLRTLSASGRRLVVRDDPANAVPLAASWFYAYEFAPFGDVDAALRREGSAWTAQAVAIGQPVGDLRGLLNGVIDETPLALLPFVRRNIPPTLVMIAARWLPDETCELLIQPIRSTDWRSAFLEDEDLATPRVKAAIQATVDAYRTAGRFVKVGRFKKLDPDCPVTYPRATALTGWE